MSASAPPLPRVPPSHLASPQYRQGRFRNATPGTSGMPGLAGTLRIMWHLLTRKSPEAVPAQPLPVLPLTAAQLLAAPDRSLYRLGHSTVLLKLRERFWLTDPVFSDRVSPFPFAGPRRFHAPPIALDALPPIAGVILSHDHYDHLDRASIRRLAERVGTFVTPLGVGDLLRRWGVAADKVRQLDWWQSTTVDGVTLTATPAQHFSGRGMFDRGRRLWCSWAIETQELKLFFSGDGGYSDGFKAIGEAIGERLGPFDVALIENGAYDVDWPHVHMQPEQTLQAHLDIGGRTLLPIHNGTFDLAMHAWHEPFERLAALADAAGVALATPRMGERVDLTQPATGARWWRALAQAVAP